jgi:hypothetical protein
MKQVVTNLPVEFVATKDVSPEKCYGLLFYGGGKAFLLTKAYFNAYIPNKFYWLCADDITKCNRIGNTDGYPSLSEAIKAMVEFGYKVYEFDSDKELLKWLAAD